MLERERIILKSVMHIFNPGCFLIQRYFNISYRVVPAKTKVCDCTKSLLSALTHGLDIWLPVILLHYSQTVFTNSFRYGDFVYGDFRHGDPIPQLIFAA
jgi:hypothetical protein